MKAVRLACIAILACMAAGVSWPSFGLIAMEDQEKESQKPEPITVEKILKVEFVIQEMAPPNLVVTVIGEVPSSGYESVKLTRVTYVKEPEDGIQDYTLTAVPPSEPAMQVLSEVKAEDTWKRYTEEAPWLKGIRVHGVGDGVVVKMLSE